MRMVGFDIFAPTPQQVKNCLVWRENWSSVVFFADHCDTQWRYASVGMGAPVETGLDRTTVIQSLRTLRLSRKEFDKVYADVRVMERAALKVLHAKR